MHRPGADDAKWPGLPEGLLSFVSQSLKWLNYLRCLPVQRPSRPRSDHGHSTFHLATEADRSSLNYQTLYKMLLVKTWPLWPSP